MLSGKQHARHIASRYGKQVYNLESEADDKHTNASARKKQLPSPLILR